MKPLLFAFLLMLPAGTMFAQDTMTSDGLLIAAKKAAFDQKNYALAKIRLYRAMQISPDYADIQVFLGRIYTWTDNQDSARYFFEKVLKKNPGYEDAAIGLADLEYWNDANDAALKTIDEGLVYHPSSTGLLYRHARILYVLHRYAEAQNGIDLLLKTDRNNAEARALADRIKDAAARNKIGLSYDFVYFDKQFSDPWHLANFSYTHTTNIGSITANINYANRFRENGVQYELEAYPHISRIFYAYLDIGYADMVGVFPQWRGGGSLYANLPKSFEGELGFRYLKFSGDPTWIYTAYLGKYYKSWLFGIRTYQTPNIYVSGVSGSYSASARYYFGGADDVIGISAGYGISPDDRQNTVLYADSGYQFRSYKAGIDFKKKISRLNVLSAGFSWFNQEYLPHTQGNQYQFSIGWVHRF
ncbi:MAG TPA: YaiO family outer membrane beta-barrel protein [Sediminibacterium sp.]|nr:YaiO family outer membrane beta-barrel protein [Sediminibacterium sp.]